MTDRERVILAVEAESRDQAKAIEWLSQPLDTFGGKTPLQLIAGGGTDNVLRYFQSVESDEWDGGN